MGIKVFGKKIRAQKARIAAQKAEQKALLDRVGYTALKAKHKKSLRPSFPDLKTLPPVAPRGGHER